MADPFIGEIRMVGFNFAPLAWALCNGQLLSIAQYDALFALIGTTYGGDGQTTFAVPDLRDRAPVHFGMGLNMGDFGGQAAHVLTTAETEHAHVLKASANQANTGNPASNVLATKRRGGPNTYAPGPNVPLDPSSISTHPGGGAPHENRQPFLGVNFVICLEGIFPSRN